MLDSLSKSKALRASFVFKTLCAFVLLCSSVSTFAQTRISGSIKDETGAAVPGATVSVNGTSIGAMSDLGGNYTISGVASDAVLTFSCIGYKAQEISVGGRSVIIAVLAEDAELIDEVVVVGYGTQKKEDISGSVAYVGGDVLENRPIANIGEGLQGVIPNDIESVTVLKDAAASAIYGARAAYGVILMTTKKGKEGKLVVSFNAQVSTGTPTHLSHQLDSWTYVNYMNVINRNAGGANFYDDRLMNYVKNYYFDPKNNPDYFYDPAIETDGYFKYCGNTDWDGTKDLLNYYGVSERKWNDRNYLDPIPLEQLTLNPNLTQNPGW